MLLIKLNQYKPLWQHAHDGIKIDMHVNDEMTIKPSFKKILHSISNLQLKYQTQHETLYFSGFFW